MDKDGKSQGEHLESMVQIAIIAAGLIFALLFLAASYSGSSVRIYSVAGAASAAEPESAEAEKPTASGKLSETAGEGLSEIVTSAAVEAPVESGEREVLMERSIDINKAGREELEKLPGIGPVLAERILQYRAENGEFLDIEELKAVEGIGEKTFEKLRDFIYAG